MGKNSPKGGESELRLPLRRQVRVQCALRHNGATVEGTSRDISSTGLSVRLPTVRAGFLSLKVGDTLDLELRLPEHTNVMRQRCEVVWLDPTERPFLGQFVVGVGLRFLELSSEQRDELQHFVNEFRYVVMVVDDEPDNIAMMERALRHNYRVLAFVNPEEALKAFAHEDVGVLITDSKMPGMSGAKFLETLNERYPELLTVRVALTAFPDIEDIERLVNVGNIFQYLRKPIDLKELLVVVRRAVDTYAITEENERLQSELYRMNERLQRENAYLRKRVVGRRGFERLIGNSQALRDALVELERIRPSGATVHIFGETGTGKELVARGLHEGGPHHKGRYVAQNCGGLTETLLQSTLFGHKRGAFTGATHDQPGVFHEADGGTLFLDEVGELPQAVQAALLRALQEGEIIPVGATRPEKVDVRIISATHKDLRAEVRQGRFREDLYFRLVVIGVRLPPLRERIGDVPILAQHFLDLHCEQYGKNVLGFTPDAMRALESYHWPGNVRELENEIERLVVLADSNTKIGPLLLSRHLGGAGAAGVGGMEAGVTRGLAAKSYDEAVIDFERELVSAALGQSHGVVSRAAALLQMERSRFGKLRRRLGLG